MYLISLGQVRVTVLQSDPGRGRKGPRKYASRVQI